MKRHVRRHEVTQPLDQSYKIIPLTQGQNALVDAEDYEWLNQWNWFADRKKGMETFYAQRNEKYRPCYMHREIMKISDGQGVDHRNHDTLDNRKGNLRISTSTQNQCNRLLPCHSTSGFIGVCWDKSRNKWISNITLNRRLIFIGRYSTAVEAAKARDEVAKKLHGEFANLNFPEVSL